MVPRVVKRSQVTQVPGHPYDIRRVFLQFWFGGVEARRVFFKNIPLVPRGWGFEVETSLVFRNSVFADPPKRCIHFQSVIL